MVRRKRITPAEVRQVVARAKRGDDFLAIVRDTGLSHWIVRTIITAKELSPRATAESRRKHRKILDELLAGPEAASGNGQAAKPKRRKKSTTRRKARA